LAAYAPPGYDEPTSRCQTISSIGALKNH